MQHHRTSKAAKLIASASVAFAIFTGLSACQENGTEITVSATGEEAAAADTPATTPAVSETTARDAYADDGGGLPADGALLAAAEQSGNPAAFVTREALDKQAADAAALAALATTTTTAAAAPTTTAAPVTTTTAAPAPAPAPVAVAPPQTNTSGNEAAFLACVRARESGGNYSVVSANGLYYGAYQFSRGTWDSTASHAGRGDLVGVPPNQASPADQDAMALHLYRWQGSAPWGGFC